MKRPLTEVITEDDFLTITQEHAQNFLKIYNFLQGEHKPCTRRFYAHLIEESEELESFLDDHCARDNKTWYLFGELVACMRNIAKVAFILRHIMNRFPAYGLNDEESKKCLLNTKNVSTLLDETILSIFEEVKKESLRLGIKFPRGTLKENLFGEIYTQKRLPFTIDEEEDLNAQKVVAKIASQYLHVIDKFEYFGWNYIKDKLDDPHTIIPDKVNEERSRELIALIHNLQSTYDNYIKHTPVESQDEGLKMLRGYISMPLHLLSVVNWCSHLYQRHIQTARHRMGRIKISAIIDESKIRDIMINFALFYTNRYLQAGKKAAKEILKKYIEIDTCEIKIPEKLGFHLRPASLVAKLARYYGTKLTLIVDENDYDASNVLSITMAAGLIARKGYKTVSFKGDKRVLQDLKLLSEYNYGEDQDGNPTTLPSDFSHLWA
jgi:phosphotransferase system HPr-like phosphotransfer protein